MEKTLSINISGWIFNINEDAFEKLSLYFKNLKAHFKNENGGDEIVSDIEARMAELLKERMPNPSTVVTMWQVDEIIKIMGQPFEMETEDENLAAEEDENQEKFKKKLFRDPMHAHIAGVASGLGKYMSLDPIIIRILFIILTTTGGLGVIIYAAIWILIPAAATTSDRIRMEGKRVDVKSIENKVKEETRYLKERFSEFGGEALEVYQRTGTIRRIGLRSFDTFFRSLGKFLLRFLKIILGIVFLAYGIGFLIAIMVLYFDWIPSLHFNGFFVQGMSMPNFLNTFIFNTPYNFILLLALSLLVIIPVVMLIFHGIRFLFNLKRNKMVGTIAWQSWVAALIISLGLSYSTFMNYKSDAAQITRYALPILSDTLAIHLNTNSYYANVLSADQKTILNQDLNYPILHDGELYGHPRLDIEESEKNEFEMKLYLSSNGKDEKDAYANISHIDYVFKTDSLGITIDPYYKLKENKKWRNQDVALKIFVPAGKYIKVNKGIFDHFNIGFPWYNIDLNPDERFVYYFMQNGKFIETTDSLYRAMLPTIENQSLNQ